MNTIAGSTHQPAPDLAFEQAMIDLVRKARDGRGLVVHLYRGDWTSASLRTAMRDFAQVVLDHGAYFFCMTPGLEKEAEAAAYDNLALLARATASAIRAGK